MGFPLTFIRHILGRCFELELSPDRLYNPKGHIVMANIYGYDNYGTIFAISSEILYACSLYKIL